MAQGGDKTRRTLAAMIMADVVGYSRHMTADEAGTVRRLKDYQATCIRPIVQRYRGRVIDAVGDSMFIEFSSVVDATSCAIALQQAVLARNAPLPDDKRIVYRMGINIGDVIVRERSLFGDGVNIAARVQTLAEPGGICLSGAAVEQIRHHFDGVFVPLGPHSVKNISRPIEVFSIPAARIGTLTAREPPSGPYRFRKVAIGVAATALVVACGFGGGQLWRQHTRKVFATELDALLADTQANMDQRSRTSLIDQYVSIGEHRALALAPRAQNRWWTGNWPSAAVAEEKVLERCELRFGEPCELAMVDLAMVPRTPGAPLLRSMPRVAYSGTFDPAQIPAAWLLLSERADITGYPQVPEPKAAAIHPRGIVAVVTGASTQRQAEIQALKACNADVNRDSDGECLLYAVGNGIVLNLRRTTSLTRQ